MEKKVRVLISLLIVMGMVTAFCLTAYGQKEGSSPSRLAVMWTSGDPDVAHRVCFMYTQNAKRQGWFDEVTLIVWGPSARLLAGDKDLQERIKGMIKGGIKVQACLACSDSYGVTEALREMGIEVKYMGRDLTDILKGDWKLLTF
jgi:hypothetical protein